MVDNAALVVSVKNRTVITALGANEAANTVFTNIESAMVVPGGPGPVAADRSGRVRQSTGRARVPTHGRAWR